jgi:hypothetical protein
MSDLILDRTKTSRFTYEENYKYLESIIFRKISMINQYKCPFYIIIKMMRTLSMIHNCKKKFEKKLITYFIRNNMVQLQKNMKPQRPYDMRYIMLGLDICIVLGNLNMYIWLCGRFDLLEKLSSNYFQEHIQYNNILNFENSSCTIAKWIHSNININH